MIIQRVRAGAIISAVSATLLAVGASSAHAEQTLTDAGGRSVKIADTSRILSIGGDITEILYALKADGKIIAVDSTSQFPADALKQKPNVGYMRALSAEGVLATNPSLIIAAKDAGPAPVVAVLKASAIPYLEVPDDETPEGVAAKIRFVAAAVGAEAAGDALAKDVEKDFALLADAAGEDQQAHSCCIRLERAERPRDRGGCPHECRRHAAARRSRECRRAGGRVQAAGRRGRRRAGA